MKLYKFPIKLKELMTLHNVSQKQLADDLHTSQPTINRWLKGENEPNLQTLVNICFRLETTPNYILGYEDDDNKLPFAIEMLAENDKPFLMIPRKDGNFDAISIESLTKYTSEKEQPEEQKKD